MKSIRHPRLIYALLAIALMMFTLIAIKLNTAPQIVVFVPGALISGAPDRTTEIQHYVIEALKKES